MVVCRTTSFQVSVSRLSLYADDTQLYISLKDERALTLLSDCFESVHWWFPLNGLSLNQDKSETIIIGTGAQQRSEGSLKLIDLGNIHIQSLESVSVLSITTPRVTMRTLTLFAKQLIITPRLYVTSGKG